jgi:DNA polymerase-3 subunit gamma/tau
MSYLVLARKWRPKDFSETVGQEHVLKALINALDTGRLHHAYLFTGTRGVGKTTIARILAKALNCETGVTSQPCGECAACREIDEGRFVDLIEVDAASKTKVDDTRDLLDNVQYAPSRGRYKVYLIDEVHMLSISSFNALLKTLEEPPPHVKFLLATTDPQRLPVTVLSRCLQFNLKRLTPRLIQDRLAHICDAEAVEFESAALATIARAADGSLRDALSLLDQAIAYCGGKVEEASVAIMLGTIDRDHVTRLLDLLAEADSAGIIDAVAEIDEKFPDYSRLLDELARSLQQIAVFQAVGRLNVDDEVSEDVVAELAERIDPADVQLYYQIAIIGRRDLDLAPDPRSGTEMTLLRMLAFRPTGESRAGAGGGAGKPVSKQPVSKGAGKRTRGTQVAAVSVAEEGGEKFEWARTIPKLGLKGAALMLASNCAFEAWDGDVLHFGLDPRSESLLTKERKDAIAEALSCLFGKRLRIEISVTDSVAETPTQEQVRIADERLDAARETLEADPNVKTLQTMFGAELKTDSIEILNSPSND